LAEPAFCPAPPRAELVRLVRARLGGPWPALRVVAGELLAAESAIDWLCADAAGGAVAVLVGEPGRELELVARALAHRAWLEPRLRGLAQLAGAAAGLRPEAPVRALALAPGFGAEAVAAARSAPPGALALGVLRCLRDAAGLHVLLEPHGVAPPPVRPEAPRAPEAVRPEPFRTRLRDSDLDLEPGRDLAGPELLGASPGARR
jgi:hypothetical protein